MSEAVLMVHGRHAKDPVPRTGARGADKPNRARLTEALRLRRLGMTFREVAKSVGCQRDRARQMVLEAERLMLLPFPEETR